MSQIYARKRDSVVRFRELRADHVVTHTAAYDRYPCMQRTSVHRRLGLCVCHGERRGIAQNASVLFANGAYNS